MIKKFLILLFMCLAMPVQASYVLWVGINENAVIHAGENTFSIPQFANIVGQPMDNMGGRILVGNEVMPPYYEWPPDSKNYDYDDLTVDDYGVDSFYLDVENSDGYADWQAIYLANSDRSAEVIFELGYWDANDNFVPLATATDILENLWNKHTYETFTLAPPTETPWRPIDFYTDYPVPESSIPILTILGICIMLLKRKQVI